ncbi:MAG: hypothetical protein EOM37_02290 [Proteobacteria bacterium]|nr:hypothetical protein [Pseudomonadota bacterium]
MVNEAPRSIFSTVFRGRRHPFCSSIPLTQDEAVSARKVLNSGDVAGASEKEMVATVRYIHSALGNPIAPHYDNMPLYGRLAMIMRAAQKRDLKNVCEQAMDVAFHYRDNQSEYDKAAVLSAFLSCAAPDDKRRRSVADDLVVLGLKHEGEAREAMLRYAHKSLPSDMIVQRDRIKEAIDEIKESKTPASKNKGASWPVPPKPSQKWTNEMMQKYSL